MPKFEKTVALEVDEEEGVLIFGKAESGGIVCNYRARTNSGELNAIIEVNDSVLTAAERAELLRMLKQCRREILSREGFRQVP